MHTFSALLPMILAEREKRRENDRESRVEREVRNTEGKEYFTQTKQVDLEKQAKNLFTFLSKT